MGPCPRIPNASSLGAEFFTGNWLPDRVQRDRPAAISESVSSVIGGLTNETPIAILPPRSTNRIVAQQGVFTLHGAGSQPLEHYYGREPEHRIAKIRIPELAAARMWLDLLLCGVHRFSIFPDLSALSRYLIHLKR
jgi:hypothetical protein